MEGCDGTAEGAPGELTLRRYLRFAEGGAGVVWVEATAIRPEARANPRQLWLHNGTVDAFAALAMAIRVACLHTNGYAPLLILQLTHSGRYSKPQGKPAPLIAYNNPLFESTPISEDCILSDDQLKSLEEDFGTAAKLAEQAGFDGVDIKACHRYLLSELLSAYERPGAYGGSFANRTRLYRNAITAAKASVSGDFIVTSRLNAYDGFPYPYGFGVTADSADDAYGIPVPDYTEAIRLAQELHTEYQMPLLNITIGNPYVNPNVNRPADTPQNRAIEPPQVGVERIIHAAAVIQESVPELPICASGFSYLRGEAVNAAAAFIGAGKAAFAGFGRMAFAYPDFYKDALAGELNPSKLCLACGKCSQLMRAGTVAGCPVRDSEIYMPYYKEHVLHRT
jgi:2,4-dienoyl-CoA reductase-like NADH-dependent reductase (Old Yellow Enzyme family)